LEKAIACPEFFEIPAEELALIQRESTGESLLTALIRSGGDVRESIRSAGAVLRASHVFEAQGERFDLGEIPEEVLARTKSIMDAFEEERGKREELRKLVERIGSGAGEREGGSGGRELEAEAKRIEAEAERLVREAEAIVSRVDERREVESRGDRSDPKEMLDALIGEVEELEFLLSAPWT
jgi:hypothetical protein